MTRLRLKWLWFRHMGPVLFAHKPLCERFKGEVLCVGPWRVCRSCAWVYLGLIVAGAALAAAHAAGHPPYPSFVIGGLPLILCLSAPPVYRHLPRLVRDVLRFSTGALVGGGGYLLASGTWWVGVPCLVVLFAMWRIYRRMRADSLTDPCLGCPELEDAHVCSGYAPQAERFRAYEEKASAVLSASGYVPKAKRKVR